MEPDKLRKLGLLQVLEYVREQEPSRPSIRFADNADSISEVSLHRNIEPKRLSSILSGDLDWIVMKAIDKDRNRRYESASAFADDLKRFLDDEPVEARPPSASYKVKKFVRKNRGWVVAATTMLLLLVAGVIGTSWGFVTALASAAEEKQAKEDAQKLARRNQSIIDIYSNSFLTANPKNGARYDMPARLVLLKPSNSWMRQPSRMIRTGESSCCSPSVFHCWNWAITRKRYNALKRRNKRFLGWKNEDAEVTVSNLAAKGICLRRLSRLTEAIEVYRLALNIADAKLPPDHDVRLQVLNNLAYARTNNGQFKEARDLLEQRLRLQSSLDEMHPEKLMTRHNLARNLNAVREPKQAREILVDVIEKRTRLLGPAHGDTLASIDELGKAYEYLGEIDLALEQYNLAIIQSRDFLGPKHPETLISVNNYGNALTRYERFDDAIEVLTEALEKAKRDDGTLPLESLSTLNNLANAFSRTGRLPDAIKAHQRILEQRREVLEESNPEFVVDLVQSRHLLSGSG